MHHLRVQHGTYIMYIGKLPTNTKPRFHKHSIMICTYEQVKLIFVGIDGWLVHAVMLKIINSSTSSKLCMPSCQHMSGWRSLLILPRLPISQIW